MPANRSKSMPTAATIKTPAPPVEKNPTNPETQIEEVIKESTISSTDVEIKKPEEQTPPLEKAEEQPAIFEVTTEEDKHTEPKKDEDTTIISADADAIDAALEKRRRSKKDDSIVEADEQTIIDKVLSQKKKGKWARK